jgi:hypothetical protein
VQQFWGSLVFYAKNTGNIPNQRYELKKEKHRIKVGKSISDTLNYPLMISSLEALFSIYYDLSAPSKDINYSDFAAFSEFKVRWIITLSDICANINF